MARREVKDEVTRARADVLWTTSAQRRARDEEALVSLPRLRRRKTLSTLRISLQADACLFLLGMPRSR